MRAKLVFIAAILLAMALVGCKKGGDVVGTWAIVDGNATATFDSGGTFTILASKSGMDTTIKGNYSITGKELTMTNNDIKVSTKSSDLTKLVPEVQAKVDALKGKSNTQIIDWDGNDKFALFAKGDTNLKGVHAIFERQK